MDKYIYGKAFNFNTVLEYEEFSCYLFCEPENFKIGQTVGLTINHKYDKLITTTEQNNLDLAVNQEGLFFRYKVSGEAGEQAWWEVQNWNLHYCSCIRTSRSYTRMEYLEDQFNFPYPVLMDDAAELFEICLTDKPRDWNTFCTVDSDDIRLAGIDWSNMPAASPNNIWEEEYSFHQSKTQLIQSKLKYWIQTGINLDKRIGD